MPTVRSAGAWRRERQCRQERSWMKQAQSWDCVRPSKICWIKMRWAGFPGKVTSMTRLYSLGSIKVSLYLKVLTAPRPPNPQASHFNHQGPQQLSPIRLIYTKPYCKLHHQNRLALECVSTMAVQSSLNDLLINLCNMLSLTSLGSSVFSWLKVALGRIINW